MWVSRKMKTVATLFVWWVILIFKYLMQRILLSPIFAEVFELPLENKAVWNCTQIGNSCTDLFPMVWGGSEGGEMAERERSLCTVKKGSLTNESREQREEDLLRLKLFHRSFPLQNQEPLSLLIGYYQLYPPGNSEQRHFRKCGPVFHDTWKNKMLFNETIF